MIVLKQTLWLSKKTYLQEDIILVGCPFVTLSRMFSPDLQIFNFREVSFFVQFFML